MTPDARERAEKPKRPSLPFMMLPATAFWIGICLSEEAVWAAGGGMNGAAAGQAAAGAPWAAASPWVLALAAGGLVALALFAVPRMRARRMEGRRAGKGSWARALGASRKHAFALPAAIAGFALLGFASGWLCWSWADAAADAAGQAGGPYRVTIVSDCGESAYGWHSDGEASPLGARTAPVRVRVMWRSPEEALPVGAQCTVRGALVRYGHDDRSRRQHRGLVVGRIKPSSIEDVCWAPTLQGLFGGVRVRGIALVEQAAGADGDGRGGTLSTSGGGEAFGEAGGAGYETCSLESLVGLAPGAAPPAGSGVIASSGAGAAILRGIVFGDRTAISGTDLDESFKLTGLAHLLAVSGSHMSTVAALVAWTLSRLRLPRRVSVPLLAALAVCYLVLTAMQPSAFRACLMAVAAGFSWFAKRRANPLAALAVAVLAMLAIDPSNAFSVGFLLSVLGVLGLCVFMPLAGRWAEEVLPRALGKVAQPLAMSLVAQGATSPVSIPVFSMLPVLGPACNMLVAPLIAALLTGGLVASMLAVVAGPALAAPLAVLCAAGDALAALVSVLGSIPYAAIPVAADPVAMAVFALAAAFALWAAWPLPGRGAMRLASLLAVAAPLVASALLAVPAGTSIVAMDVGQGDAILVTSGGHRVLVDTGQYDTTLRAALGRNHVRHLDAVVLTHFDEDHCGALGAMRSMVGVDAVVVASGAQANAQDDPKAAAVLDEAASVVGDGGCIVEARAGAAIAVSDELSLEVLWPQEAVGELGNAESVCLLARFDADGDGAPEFQALLTGDAEHEELAGMIAAGLGDIDVLKVGHHGSAGAVDEPSMETLRPEVALISVGAGNRFGHPTAETLGLLEQYGAKVFRTDLQGDVCVAFEPGRLTVTCANM